PVEASRANPCPICESTSGCQVAVAGTACRTWSDARDTTIGKRDGLPYYVYGKDEIKAKHQEWLIAEAQRALSVLIAPGSVVELRVPKVATSSYRRPHTESGYFDSNHLKEMAKYALKYTGGAPGVYLTMNPVKPELLARRSNRCEAAEVTTNDTQIVARQWLLLDIDSAREAGISASDSEKAAAQALVNKVREHLRGLGWPEPVLCDSGNGYHLLYRIDLPADDGRIVEQLLKVLAQRFDSATVKIDQSVFNPAR